MVEKRIILFVSFAVIVVIAASVGFYEFGLYNGEASGFRSGFAQGASSILIQPMTEIDLEPNQTVLVIPNLALVAPNFPPPNNL
ncbi:MAG: hypothetical protein M1431_01930, partial [Candidatus Thermoplasmatota archaeon]|nr:hypothetical protein [Candidatus Thermoplasmatota archaeon]